MVAATVSDRVRTQEPDRELVVLEASDGETFTSEKFKVVRLAHLNWAEDMGTSVTPLSYAIGTGDDTNVVTIHMDGVAADKAVSLELIGKLGN